MKRSKPDDAEGARKISSSGRAAAAASVRLMLHAVDGTVPYLTPDLLKRCFPASNDDVLSIGLAVRDICAVPFFQDGKTKKKMKTCQKKNAAVTDAAADGEETTTCAAVVAPKPRGYKFSSTVRLDPWLLPYKRVVVPTFDLLDDCMEKTKKRAGHPNTTANHNANHRNELQEASAKHVSLWTPNGRHPITCPQYCESAMGLAQDNNGNDDDSASSSSCAVAVVPLFEMMMAPTLPLPDKHHMSANHYTATKIVAAELLEKKRWKQKRSTIQRNQQWTTNMILQGNSNNMDRKNVDVWAPVSVASDTALSWNDDASTKTADQQHVSWIMTKVQEGAIQGVALIGWHHIANVDRRWEILQSIHNDLSAAATAAAAAAVIAAGQGDRFVVPTIAVLSTQSTLQILQLLTCSSSNTVVIGTDLPAVWARSKKAFLCDIALYRRNSPSTKTFEESSRNVRACTEEQATRTSNSSITMSSASSSLILDEDGCVNLSSETDGSNRSGIGQQHPWFRDQRALVPGCTCMTCQSHSRAYLHHLACSNELLAEILLFVHNLHHVLLLLRTVNAIHKSSNSNENSSAVVADLCDHIQSQFGTQPFCTE